MNKNPETFIWFLLLLTLGIGEVLVVSKTLDLMWEFFSAMF